MSDNKTAPTGIAPQSFLQTVEPMRRRQDGERLLRFFTEVTGYAAKMWGPSIIGFGHYRYRYKSGRSGEYIATGFSPRKAALSIYIMPGYQDYSEMLGRLGKHKLGKSCLYVKQLDDIDMAVLQELVQAGLRDLNDLWPVTAD